MPIRALAALLCGLIFTPSLLIASTRSSNSPGDWFSANTWSGGVAPQAGDSVVILHAVTLGGSASLSGTPALRIEANGSLAILAGASLTLGGSASITSGSLSIADDATLFMGRNTSLGVGAGGSFLLSGSLAHRASLVDRDAGQAPVRLEAGSKFLSSYANITGIRLFSSGAAETVIDRTRFSNAPLTVSLGTGSSFQLSSSSWVGSASDTALEISVTVQPKKAVMYRNVFDKKVNFRGTAGLSIAENVFLAAFDMLLDVGSGWTLFHGNLVHNPNAWDLLLAGDTSGNMWLVDGNFENPHFVSALVWRDVTMDGDVFHFTGSDDNGDAVLLRESGNFTIRNSLVLPNGAGKNSATLFSALGGPGTTIVAEHNTYFTGTQGAAVGETYAGHAGMLASFRSNIAWSTSPAGYKLYDSGPDDYVPDLVVANAVDYNCGFNLLSGSNGDGYHFLEFRSGRPGVHDMEVDPQFYEPGRNIATWDARLGGAGTIQGGLARLAGMNDDGAAGGVNVLALVSYVRTGYSPQNLLLKGRAHDGGDVGAVEVGASDVRPPIMPTPSSTSAYPAPAPIIYPPPAPFISTPTPTPAALPALALALRVRVSARSVTLRWRDLLRGKYELTLKRAGKVLSRRIVGGASFSFKKVRPGSYSARLRPSTQRSPRVQAETVTFRVR